MIKGTRKSAGKPAATSGAEGDPPRDDADLAATPVGADGSLNIAQQIGLLLRQTREAKGVSLDEASRQTRIRVVHLQAIEAGEIGSLPGPAFVIGFLRLYVKFLNVSEKETVDRFVEQWHQVDGFLAMQFFPPPPTTSRSRPTMWLIILGLIGLVALIVWYSQANLGFQLPSLGHLGGGSKSSMARAHHGQLSDDSAADESEGLEADNETDTEAGDRAAAPSSSPFVDEASTDVQGGGEEDESEPGEQEEDETPGRRVTPPGGLRAKADGVPAATAGLAPPVGKPGTPRVGNGMPPAPNPLVSARRSGVDVGETKPVVAAKPLLDGKPTPDAKPVAEVKPVPETKSVAVAKPPLDAKPVTEVRPVPDTKPVAVAKPAPDVKVALDTRPVSDAKPMFDSKPVVSAKPPLESRPVGVDIKPAAPPKPVLDIKPVAAARPVPDGGVGTEARRVSPVDDTENVQRLPPLSKVSGRGVEGGGPSVADRVETEKIVQGAPLGAARPQASGANTSGFPNAGQPDFSVSASAGTTAPGDAGAGSRVVMVALHEAWVSIKGPDGKFIVNRTLKPGERVEIPGSGQYSAKLGNAGGLQVTVDGRVLPSLGRRGEVVRDLDVTAQGLLERFRGVEPE
ncbi:MAG: DUF4115 domain-containing protein [Magnetococcales bacterium]|nr:DUF4115 domain-containing protein [Magnetococcales bacterium]